MSAIPTEIDCRGLVPGRAADDPPTAPIDAFVKYAVEYATAEWLVIAKPT